MSYNVEKILNKTYHSLHGSQPASAIIARGIPLDPNYIDKEPFFINGKAKFKPTPIQIPKKTIDPLKKAKQDYEAKVFKIMNGDESTIIGGINSPDSKLSPADVLNQYLHNIENGADALLTETKRNYSRDKNTLPWAMNPNARSKRYLVKIQDSDSGFFNPLTKVVIIGNNFPIASNKPQVQPNQLPQILVMYNIENNLAYGKKGGTEIQTYEEVVTHEITHTFLMDKLESHKEEALKTNINNKNPYLFAISEEYKVGVLLFLNRTRQLTGNKLTNPQKIHQVFNEIINDPSILDKNYTPEEAKLLRTYLLLKKTNPAGAILLRNATARDCQYLA